MSILRNKIFKISFLVILIVEFLSFFSYFYPTVNKGTFLVIIVVTLAALLYKPEYGVLILLAELFIGSKGYLFYLDFGGFSISIRIALWLIVMAVWAGKIINGWIKNKKLEIEFFKSSHFPYFLALFIFIGLGFINGLLNKNGFENIFFDFNGWLYFLLVFPVYDVICGARNVETPRLKVGASLQNIFLVFTAAIIWLSIKTFFLLFIFSHGSTDAVYEIYRWVRTSGVGEITNIQGGFYRIFFQSHIFTLIGFFVLFIFLAYHENSDKKKGIEPSSGRPELDSMKLKNKNFYLLFSISCFLFSTIIISFSRSFWVGIIAGFVLFFTILAWQKIGMKKILKVVLNMILVIMLGFLFIIAIIKFPFPKPIEGFNTVDLLSKRVSNLNESAVASRWDLLPPLWKEIKNAPILGKGFGATVSYKSSDPRVLQANPSGEYITYAFEWGWLDIWLKLGIGGVIAYIFLIGKIIADGLTKIFNFPRPRQAKRGGQLLIFNSDQSKIILGLIIGLAVVAVVNIFSPYLNHPLGIGYLILVSFIISASKEKGALIK